MNIEIALKIIHGKEIPAVTSLQVAEHFRKNHKDVLRDIRVTIEKCSHEFNERNFAPVEYTDAKGEKRPMYILSKDGFMMVAMGYITPEAMTIKETYIARFNEMEERLRNSIPDLPNFRIRRLPLVHGRNSTNAVRLPKHSAMKPFAPKHGSATKRRLPQWRQLPQQSARSTLSKTNSDAESATSP